MWVYLSPCSPLSDDEIRMYVTRCFYRAIFFPYLSYVLFFFMLFSIFFRDFMKII